MRVTKVVIVVLRMKLSVGVMRLVERVMVLGKCVSDDRNGCGLILDVEGLQSSLTNTRF